MARILVINPNSSVAVTAAIDDAMAPLRIPGGPAITVERLETGPPGILTQHDADGVVMPVAAWVARDDADAFVLACFSDPGLQVAREAASGRPVMGIAESGILAALTRGERFGIIALSPISVRRQLRYVRQLGLAARHAGSEPVDASAEQTAGDAIGARMADAGRTLVARGADVLVLGCAGMARHRRAVEAAAGVPVIEPTQHAAAAAIAAVLLREA